MSKFDPTKPVKTRKGWPARILETDAHHPDYPIIALVTPPDGREQPETYTSEGLYYIGHGEPNAFDLVNVPEKHVRWLNLYPEHAVMSSHETRGGADANANGRRIACIRIEFEEGEGLS